MAKKEKLVSSDEYQKLAAERPRKFKPEQVNYQKAKGKEEQCGRCFHYFTREIDAFGVCEIMRPESEDEHVKPDWRCDFFTPDGEKFPLLLD